MEVCRIRKKTKIHLSKLTRSSVHWLLLLVFLTVRVIAIAGVPIVTVTPADAQDNLTTIDQYGSLNAFLSLRVYPRSKQECLFFMSFSRLAVLSEPYCTIDGLATQWSEAIDAALKRASQRRLSPWARFVAQVQASVQTAFGRLIESAITIIPRALAALLVIGLFWAIAAFVRWLMRIIFRHIVEDLTRN